MASGKRDNILGFVCHFIMMISNFICFSQLLKSIKFGNLNEYYAISEESERDYEFTMAWADCVAKGDDLGLGALHGTLVVSGVFDDAELRTVGLAQETLEFAIRRPRAL